MDILKQFVVTLVSTLILITAVEMIVPDNDMKKYVKFVLGTILTAVMLSPIINLFLKGENELSKMIDNYSNEMSIEKRIENKTGLNETREKSFIDNLNRNCENLLNKKFEKYSFRSDIESSMNFDEMEFNINKVTIYVSEKGNSIKSVEKIKEIEINKNEEKKKEEKKKSIKNEEEIKKYIALELDVSTDKVTILREGE